MSETDTYRPYRICSKTVMDTIGDPDIKFDRNGISNYYHEFKERLKVRVPQSEEAKVQLKGIVDKVKSKGIGKRYDCIIGVSGGVDSTYTAWLVKKLGLRPLAVHLDNGWNSELAVQNIENIMNKLNIDLYTEVLDWDMFKALQISFLKGSTPDGEIPTDHAINSLMYQIAAKYGIKYVISGMNFRSEGMLPPSWARGHLDWKYIKGVHRSFSVKKLTGYPHMTVFQFLKYNLINRIRVIGILNYIDFKKDEASDIITKELGWRKYGGKHYESIYTRFYQSYVLPTKFGIDKRKAHLTCLMISTGEITREEALDVLKTPPADIQMIEDDKEYVLKKLGISETDFQTIMNTPVKSILDYPNNYLLEMKFRRLLNSLRNKKLFPN